MLKETVRLLATNKQPMDCDAQLADTQCEKWKYGGIVRAYLGELSGGGECLEKRAGMFG